MSNISGIVKSAKKIMCQGIGADSDKYIEAELTQSEKIPALLA